MQSDSAEITPEPANGCLVARDSCRLAAGMVLAGEDDTTTFQGAFDRPTGSGSESKLRVTALMRPERRDGKHGDVT